MISPVPIPRSAPPRPDIIRHEAQNKEFAKERKMQVAILLIMPLVFSLDRLFRSITPLNPYKGPRVN